MKTFFNVKKIVWAVVMLGAMVTVTSCSDDDDDDDNGISISDVIGKYSGTLAVSDGGENVAVKVEVNSTAIVFDESLIEEIVKYIEESEDVEDIMETIEEEDLLTIAYTAKVNDAKDEVVLTLTDGTWEFSYEVEAITPIRRDGEGPEMRTIDVKVIYVASEEESTYADGNLKLNLVVESVTVDGYMLPVEDFNVAINLKK